MNAEQRYLTQDLHFDLEQADTHDDLTELFRRFLRTMLSAGLQDFKVRLPGKYGRTRGSFVFKGDTKSFSYELIVTLKDKKMISPEVIPPLDWD